MSRIVASHVTNSSSSSFIVWLPKMPTSIEDAKNMFFGELNSITKESYDGWNSETKQYNMSYENLSTFDIAKSLFQSMEKLTKKKIKQEMNDGTPYPDSWIINAIGEYPRSREGEWKEKRPKWLGHNTSDEDKDKYEDDFRVYSEEIEKMQNEWANKVLALYEEKHKKSVVVSWEYSDNDGSFGAFMEHDMPASLIVPYIRISKH